MATFPPLVATATAVPVIVVVCWPVSLVVADNCAAGAACASSDALALVDESFVAGSAVAVGCDALGAASSAVDSAADSVLGGAS